MRFYLTGNVFDIIRIPILQPREVTFHKIGNVAVHRPYVNSKVRLPFTVVVVIDIDSSYIERFVHPDIEPEIDVAAPELLHQSEIGRESEPPKCLVVGGHASLKVLFVARVQSVCGWDNERPLVTVYSRQPPLDPLPNG